LTSGLIAFRHSSFSVDTSEPVGVRVDQILLIEQKRPENGGAVAVYLAHGKELYVMESFKAVRDMILAHAPKISAVAASA